MPAMTVRLNASIVSCLHENDRQMYAKCIELDRYCADMCRTAAAFMARSDEHTLLL